MDTLITLFVPKDHMQEFIHLINGAYSIVIPIYSEKMLSPVCLQVSVPILKYNKISHLIK